MKLGKVYFYNHCSEKASEMKKIERNWRLIYLINFMTDS